MVLADGGLCCIDGFDKMSSEHQVSGIAGGHGATMCIGGKGWINSKFISTYFCSSSRKPCEGALRAITVNGNLKRALLSSHDLTWFSNCLLSLMNYWTSMSLTHYVSKLLCTCIVLIFIHVM
uniref:DNA helicase n=1 Tax=Kalanchoe fedtschenkoi TaxID=63787 RepID=A0A7N0VHA5_KALFE